jgi:hypothetical protein
MTTARQPDTAWRRWVHFWFAPADPTAMGFIRVVTGVLVLYTHLAYSFDLYSFFGEKGWYGLDAVNRERREFPWNSVPIADGWKWWEETARFPEEPHRRAALLAYTRSLPTDLATLNRKLAVLGVEGLDPDGYPVAVGQAAGPFASTLSDDPKVREATLKALANEIARDPKEQFPLAFDALADPGRPADPNWRLKQLRRDLEEFYSTLPQAARDPADTADAWDRKRRAAADARRYIASYLFESPEVQRYNFLKFARDLACPPAERERKLDYFAYWNTERRYTGSTGNPIFSIWFHITTPAEMAAAHAVMLAVMLMFTVGLFTRTTAVLTWLCAVSYIHRNQQVLFGQDTMMNILLLYLMIGNCGAALSLDRLIARYRAAKASLKRCGHIDGPTAAFLAAPPPSVAAGFAQRLLQIHFCFIYMASGLSKLKGAAWWNTNAFWDTMANPEFTMIHYQWYQDLLRLMIGQRAVYAASAAFVVGFTLVLEIGLPFLVWTKLRPYVVIGGFLLHFGIGIFMGLLIFSLFMMTMLVGYLPGSVIRRQLFGAATPEQDRVRVTVNPAVDADVSRVAWAVAKDSSGRIEVVKP